jgi:hypothetical protein
MELLKVKNIVSLLTWVLSLYTIAVLFTLYGVAMGFIASDSQDMLSQSIRFIASLF